MLTFAYTVSPRTRRPGWSARWPRSAGCGSHPTPPTRSRPGSPAGSTPAPPARPSWTSWSRGSWHGPTSGPADGTRSPSTAESRSPQTVFDDGLRDRTPRRTRRSGAAADRSRARRRGTRRRPARPRCCSSATRPASRTRPASSRPTTTVPPGWPPSPRCWRSWRAGVTCRRARLARRAGRAARPDGPIARPADVVIEVAGGRIAAVARTAGPVRRASRCPGSPCPASPTPTRTPSTGRCAGAPSTAGAPSGPGASGCTRSAGRLDPDTLPRPGPRRLRRDGAGRDHLCRRVPLPAPRAGRHARTPTPTRWARRCVAAADEAGLRITLLDTCYLTADCGR